MLKITKILNVTVFTIGIAMVIYHFIALFLSPLDPLDHINTHLTFALLLIFLPALSKSMADGRKYTSLVLSCFLIASLVSTVYVFVFSEELQLRMGQATISDLVIGVIIIIVVFEAVRRGVGLALPLFGLVFLAYAFWGHYLPRPLYHWPVPFTRMISWLSISVTSGVYSNLLVISANIVFLFVMFASILEITKARDFFTMVGALVGRKMRGGTAQTAVISSGLVGSVTGSGAVNVILTGGVTIPTMKKSGYSPEFAGAVEAVASSGGMLMPPVMGAVAFMMVALTGLTYIQICIAAAIPALLYYLSAGLAVYLNAGKEKIPASKEEIDTRLLLRRAPLFLGPLITLIVLLALQYSAQLAAGTGLLVGLILGYLSKETRPSFKRLIEGLTQGAKTASVIAVMLAMGGIFVSVMSVTQLGPKMVSLVGGLSGGYLPLILILTMLVSLILGCAVPMSGGYLIVAILVTPLLLKAGLSVLQAHFFALFFSVIGFLTPPVAPSALVASGIANSNFLRTAFQSLRIAAPCIVIPFMFVYDPTLLGQFTAGPLSGLVSIVSAIIVVFSLAILLFNYFITKVSWWEMILAAASLGGNIYYFFSHEVDKLALMIGMVCFLVLLAVQIVKIRSEKRYPISSAG